MKTIIRIEHECGNGLWMAVNKNNYTVICKGFSFYNELYGKHSRFPVPRLDGLLNIQDDEYCAFKSIEQIQQWIEKDWFKEIVEFGFKIWMIDVSVWREGEYQVLFKKKDIVSKKDISELFINYGVY